MISKVCKYIFMSPTIQFYLTSVAQFTLNEVKGTLVRQHLYSASYFSQNSQIYTEIICENPCLPAGRRVICEITYFCSSRLTTAVITMFNNDSGISPFHPKFIN